MPVPSSFSMERRYIGLNLWQNPQDINEGYVTQADNVFVYGGNLVTRWPFLGLFTTPLSNPITCAYSYIKPNGNTNIVFVSGGKVYQTTKGTAVYTEIKIGGITSFSLVSANVYMARLGTYLYIVDGSGPLYRLSIDNSGTATASGITSLTAPTIAPSSALTNQTIDAISSTTGWQVDTVTASSNVLPNAGDLSMFSTSTEYTSSSVITLNFTDLVIASGNKVSGTATVFTKSMEGKSLVITGGSGFTNATYTINSVDSSGNATLNSSPGTIGSTGGAAHITGTWIVSSPTNDLDFNTSSAGLHQLPAGYTGTWAFMDDPGEGLTSPLVQNVTISNTLNETRYATQFQYSMLYYSSDPTSRQSLTATLQVYSDTAGTALIGTASATFNIQYATQSIGQLWQDIFDFPNLGTDIRSYTFSVKGANSNVRGSGYGASSSALSIMPISNLFTVLPSSPSGVTIQNNYVAAGKGPANNGRFGGARITKDCGSDQDWHNYNRIALNLSTLGGLSLTTLIANGLQIMVSLRQYNAGSPGQTHYFTNTPVTLDPVSSTASVDISTIPVAIRTAFRYFEILFSADLVTAPTAFSPVFTITSISNAGNLSVGFANYTYVVTEKQSTIESDPSPATVSLTPTVSQAESIEVLGSGYPYNGATDTYNVYRQGGTNTAGLYYLVASLPIGSDQAMDSTHTYSWNHTTKTFIDNTPDSALNFGTTLITGRGAPPTGAQCIAIYQNRLALGVGSSLYLSWLSTAASDATLYFNTINLDPSVDPNATIKGGMYPVGGSDNDPIQALVSEGTQLVVLKQRSRRLFMGTDPTNFSLLDDLLHDGIGNIAPRAVELVSNQVWNMGPGAVYAFSPVMGPMTQPIPMSKVIEPLLNPNAQGGTPISASAYKGAAMIFHSQRLWLFAPTAGDSQNTVVYVYDTRQQGWTRFMKGFTGGCALSTQTDTDDLYLCGYDGQLYQVDYARTTAGDKALPSSTPAAIAQTVAGRGFGQEGEGAAYFAKKRPTRFYANITANETCTATFGVNTVSAGAPNWTQTYGLISGTNRPRLKVSNDVRDDVETISISVSTFNPLNIIGFGIEAAQGRPGDQ